MPSILTEYDRSPPAVARETNGPDDILQAGNRSQSPLVINNNGHCVYKCAKAGFEIESRKPHPRKHAVVQYARIV
jgi:hypothetical protein